MNHLPPPNTGPSDPETRRQLWLRYLQRIGIPVGLVTLAGGVGATDWGYHFVSNDLSPLVAKNLTQALNRPVELGRVEQFNLTSLQFGPSALPATAADPDQLSIPSVRVRFNLLQLVVDRTLNLDITAIQPQIYLEQSQTDAWVDTRFTAQKDTGPIKLKIDTIRVEDAKAILVPWKGGAGRRQPITLIDLRGKVNLLDQNQRFVYDLVGKSIAGGNFTLKGKTQQDQGTQTTHLQVAGQHFLVSEIDRLVNVPAMELQAGRVTGAVNLQMRRNTAELDGKAQFTGVTLRAEGVPQLLTQGQGQLVFKGTAVQLINTTGRYGLVPAVVNGTVDTQKGLNLAIQVKSATLPDVVKSLQLPLPVKIAGAIRADLQLTGSIAAPVLEGMAQSTQPAGNGRYQPGKRLFEW